jgi:hypothetical protein
MGLLVLPFEIPKRPDVTAEVKEPGVCYSPSKKRALIVESEELNSQNMKRTSFL